MFLILLGVLAFTGCHAKSSNSGENDPKYPWWELVFIKPNFMNVWVEDSSVEDIDRKTFLRAGGGNASGAEPNDDKESARGWIGVEGTGKPVIGPEATCPAYASVESMLRLRKDRFRPLADQGSRKIRP